MRGFFLSLKSVKRGDTPLLFYYPYLMEITTMFFNKSPFRFQELRTQIKAELLSLGFEPILPFAKHCYIVVFQGTKYRWEIYLDRTKAEVSVINNSTNKLIKVNGKDDVREVPYSNKKAPLTHLEEILGEALFTRFQRVA